MDLSRLHGFGITMVMKAQNFTRIFLLQINYPYFSDKIKRFYHQKRILFTFSTALLSFLFSLPASLGVGAGPKNI